MARGGHSNTNQNTNGNTTIPTQHPVLDQLSVYYVHPGENPVLAIISPLLSGRNYHSWSRNMKRALILKNKFKFVNGSLPMPSDFDPSFESWERCNNLVLSWILNSVETSIAKSIASCENAATAWNLLKQRFSQTDRVRIFELQQEIMNLKQGNNSVTHFGMR
jgi:hypothetical protein